jgi:hypothetical protein
MSWERLHCADRSIVPACGLYARTVYASLQNTGDMNGTSTNMINWVNNFDMTQIKWGCTTYAQFNTYTDTAPETISPNQGDGGQTGSFTLLYGDPINQGPTTNTLCARSQILLNGNLQYMVLALGYVIGPNGYEAAIEGCTSTIQANPGCVPFTIDDLPLPDPTFLIGGVMYCDQYIFGVVGPNPTGGLTGMFPNLAAFVAAEHATTVPSFANNQACNQPPGNPFPNT